MDVMTAIEKRRSVRSYQKKEIPEKILLKILEAARLAPSAKNLQDYKLIVIKDPSTKDRLGEAARGQMFIAEAPVIIAAVSTNPEYVMRCGIPAHGVDLGIAIDHMTLAATEEGLGTCWIGAFFQEEVKKILGVPEQYKVVALLPLGYPADQEKAKSRKKLEEIVCYEKF